MEGRTLAWFQWMTRNGQFASLPVYLQALQTCFAPSQYEDPTGALFKLTQCSTVNTYLSEFEDLANRIIGLPPPFLLNCFISGLASEIRREVQALQPLTLVQATGLARLQEEKFVDHYRSFCSRTLPSPSSTISSCPSSISSTPPPLLLTPLKPPSSLPVKRLSPEELASRRECGLCFKFNEKFHRGHKCASKAFLLIMDDNESFPNITPDSDFVPKPSDPPAPTRA